MTRFAVVEDRSGKTGYAPRGAALELWRCKRPEVIIPGPSETGKTRACLEKLDALLWKYPGAQAVMLRKTYKSLVSSALQTYVRKVLPAESPVKEYGGDKPEWFDYPNGSRLYVGGMDNADKVLSSERDFIYVNQAEELSLADWETLTTRATGRAGNSPYAQLMGDCNPSNEHHWIKSRPQLQPLLESRHEDNPVLYDAQGRLTEQGRKTMAVLDALTGVRKERLRYGRWVSAEGVVFTFDAKIHLIDQSAVPPCSTCFASVDWGYTNPGVILVWKLDGDGRMYLVHEVYQTGKLIEWWAEQAVAIKSQFCSSVFVCDPSEPAYIQQFIRSGVYAIAADNNIKAGIQAVESRLAVARNSKPRLQIVRGCLAERDEALAAAFKPVCLADEMDVYCWSKSNDGRPIKEVPVDVNNHACDAARYGAMYADSIGLAGNAAPETGGRRTAASTPRGVRVGGDFRKTPRGV